MSDRYEPRNMEDVNTIKKLRAQIEDYRDFIGWLFDNSGDEGIHWMSESEAWDLFRAYQDKIYSDIDKDM